MNNKTKFNEMHTIVINMNMLDENIHNIWYIYIYI